MLVQFYWDKSIFLIRSFFYASVLFKTCVRGGGVQLNLASKPHLLSNRYSAMQNEPTNAEKIRRLPWTYAMSATNTIFLSFTLFGSVFLLFLDEIGLDKKQVGFLLSLIPFCGVIAVFIGSWVARIGAKRIFRIFYTARKFAAALLLAVPWIIAWDNQRLLLYYVGGLILIFAICRAVAETAWYPWAAEIVPNTIRGKFSAANIIVQTVAGIASMAFASFILGSSDSISRYLWLFSIGLVMGLVSAMSSMMIPGGGPIEDEQAESTISHMLRPLGDRQFLLFLIATAVTLLGMQPLVIFIPLYMKETVGLLPQQVVLLDLAMMLAALLASMPWGWAADRYGSKPIMLLGLLLFIFYPLGLILIPRYSESSLPAAICVVFIYGMISIGWLIGNGRLFYNRLIPAENRSDYTSVYYAWIGIFGAISPLLGGWILERGKNIDMQWMGLHLNPYSPLIGIFFIAVLIAAILMGRLRVEGEMPTWTFASMFFRGDPITAVWALISYNAAGDERSRISATERLGQTRSPLNVDELIDSLTDPSFNVRHEAIISIARNKPDTRLTNALINVLKGSDPNLSVTAAWALGRVGGKTAIQPLRELLNSDYKVLASRCARALGILGDLESMPVILAKYREADDDGLRIAYASTLGALGCQEAIPELLYFLARSPLEEIRKELLLAVSRIANNEKQTIRLQRNAKHDPDTVFSQVIENLKSKIRHIYRNRNDLTQMVDSCANAFAAQNTATGVTLLIQLIRELSDVAETEQTRIILKEVCQRLSEFGPARMEYIILAIVNLHTALDTYEKEDKTPMRGSC